MAAMTASSIAPLHDLHPAAPDILADVLAGLATTPKTLPSKYFYDARGSALFEAICGTPEYYLTRAELAILQRHGSAIAAALGEGVRLVEYGVGAGDKTRLLLAALPAPAAYVPVEISRSALLGSVRALAADFPGLSMLPVCADFTAALPLPYLHGARSVVYLAGSTLGNFVDGQDLALLRRMRDTAGPGGRLLLGLDLKKDTARLEAAYNDAAGFTAAFTLNLLTRLNRELGADFDLRRFAHRARYSGVRGRIETDLVSRVAQHVHVAGQRFHFADGEPMRVECSSKYDDADIDALAAAAGLQRGPQWRDPEGLFVLQMFEVPAMAAAGLG